MLASSVFMAKIFQMLNYGEHDEKTSLVNHILSYRNSYGLISDPLIHQTGNFRRLTHAIRSGNFGSYSSKIVDAETRQAIAALRGLSYPSPLHINLPKHDLDYYWNLVQSFNWSKPWSAGSHLSSSTGKIHLKIS